MRHLQPVFCAGLFTAACAGPGLSYQARLPAGAPEAAEYRDVEVGAFVGPQGGWFADRLEATLAQARLDGQPWFLVGAGRGARLAGLYAGAVSVDDVDVREYEQTVRKCVEWDGLFDCERRADVVEVCYETAVEVSAFPELVDRRTGAIVFSGRYAGAASDTECFEPGEWSSDDPVDELVREALAETLPQIRRDVAPRNDQATAPLIAEALDPEARADPRFGHALAAAKAGNGAAACLLWEELARAYPNGPAVAHNYGACAEAAGDYAAAEAAYAAAARLSAGLDADAGDTIRASLSRIAERRAGAAWLDQVAGPGS